MFSGYKLWEGLFLTPMYIKHRVVTLSRCLFTYLTHNVSMSTGILVDSIDNNKDHYVSIHVQLLQILRSQISISAALAIV